MIREINPINTDIPANRVSDMSKKVMGASGSNRMVG
jgi:hypothetical protein